MLLSIESYFMTRQTSIVMLPLCIQVIKYLFILISKVQGIFFKICCSFSILSLLVVALRITINLVPKKIEYTIMSLLQNDLWEDFYIFLEKIGTSLLMLSCFCSVFYLFSFSIENFTTFLGHICFLLAYSFAFSMDFGVLSFTTEPDSSSDQREFCCVGKWIDRFYQWSERSRFGTLFFILLSFLSLLLSFKK